MYGPFMSFQVNAPVRPRVAALATITVGPGVGATNVWSKIVCVGTVQFAHRAARIGMTGPEAARGATGLFMSGFLSAQLEKVSDTATVAGLLIPAPLE